MNKHGVRQLSLFSVRDWKEKILDLLYEPGTRSYNRGSFEYDARINGVYYFSHLDGDIARLSRFRKAIVDTPGAYEVLCFLDQVSLVQKYIGSRAGIKVLDRSLLETELGIKNADIT